MVDATLSDESPLDPENVVSRKLRCVVSSPTKMEQTASFMLVETDTCTDDGDHDSRADNGPAPAVPLPFASRIHWTVTLNPVSTAEPSVSRTFARRPRP